MICEETTIPNQSGPNMKTIQVPDQFIFRFTGVGGTACAWTVHGDPGRTGKAWAKLGQRIDAE